MKRRFILAGFTQELGFRRFSFEAISEDRTRTTFTVRADLSLARQYGIIIQELPLLCHAILERHDAADPNRSLMFTEDDMRNHARDNAAAKAAAAFKRKPPRRPSENVGSAWRIAPLRWDSPTQQHSQPAKSETEPR